MNTSNNGLPPLCDNEFAYKCDRISIKPFIKWVGGKSQLLGELEKVLQENNNRVYTKYCEPFVGGGALFFDVVSKYNFKEFLINDINCELINTYQVIKSNVKELISMLEITEAKFLSLNDIDRKEYYYQVVKEFNDVELNDETATKKGVQFIFLNKTCFNGLYRVNKNGKFNVPMGTYKNPKICDRENLISANKILQQVKITCGDYSCVEQFIDNETFVYIDPPYRPISSTSAFTTYSTCVFDDNEQIRLSEFIKEIDHKGAKFSLSNSDPKNIDASDNFFDELYKEYKILRVSANRMINSKGNKRGKINELIIYNQSEYDRGEKKMKRNFNEWLKNFKESICDYSYYTDFKKVYENVDYIKVELNILNSLIGSKNIENDFKKLVCDYPKVLKCIPILLAVRGHEIYTIDGNGEYLFNFSKQNYSIDEYALFMQKTGLFNLISDHVINNLVDYVTGVEVGLDSNGRKNRGGHLMENLVEDYLIKAGLKKNEDYFKEMKLSAIQSKWNINLSGISNDGKAEKRFDFVVKTKNTVYGIETNFYSSGGSKLNETARSYKTIALEAKNIDGFKFVWFTDGCGWKSARHNLEETFDILENIYCINDLEKGVMHWLFK